MEYHRARRRQDRRVTVKYQKWHLKSIERKINCTNMSFEWHGMEYDSAALVWRLCAKSRLGGKMVGPTPAVVVYLSIVCAWAESNQLQCRLHAVIPSKSILIFYETNCMKWVWCSAQLLSHHLMFQLVECEKQFIPICTSDTSIGLADSTHSLNGKSSVHF